MTATLVRKQVDLLADNSCYDGVVRVAQSCVAATSSKVTFSVRRLADHSPMIVVDVQIKPNRSWKHSTPQTKRIVTSRGTAALKLKLDLTYGGKDLYQC